MTHNNLPKIKYCDKRLDDNSSCSHLAKFIVSFESIKEKDKMTKGYRCDEHKLTHTKCRKAIHYEVFEQKESIRKVNDYLITLIGKTIKSTFHTAKQLQVKYLKYNCSVMCLQPITKKWKLVYYHQIKSIEE